MYLNCRVHSVTSYLRQHEECKWQKCICMMHESNDVDVTAAYRADSCNVNIIV